MAAARRTSAKTGTKRAPATTKRHVASRTTRAQTARLDARPAATRSKRVPLLLAHLEGRQVARAVIGKAEARGWKGLFDTANTPATRSAVLRGTPEAFRQALEAAAGRPVDELGGEERLEITVRL